ncbi:transcriptional regulator [Bacillus sp. 165]|nr:transcriptional regulator [Bacillus sp. 165]MBO9129162.1 transcriptional regulator [Bacillus sp. 165]
MTQTEIIMLLAPIMILQSTVLFVSAKKRGRNAWFWGIWGLIQCPMPAVLYWLIVLKPFKKKKRGEN